MEALGAPTTLGSPCSKWERYPIRKMSRWESKWCIATTESEHASDGRKPAWVEKMNWESSSTKVPWPAAVALAPAPALALPGVDPSAELLLLVVVVA